VVVERMRIVWIIQFVKLSQWDKTKDAPSRHRFSEVEQMQRPLQKKSEEKFCGEGVRVHAYISGNSGLKLRNPPILHRYTYFKAYKGTNFPQTPTVDYLRLQKVK
jgi:hypothetical protein